MNTILILRPTGEHRAAFLTDTKVLETSVEHMLRKPAIGRYLRGEDLAAVILEDLTYSDLDPAIRADVSTAMWGRSCPLVTRWTRLREGDAR